MKRFSLVLTVVMVAMLFIAGSAFADVGTLFKNAFEQAFGVRQAAQQQPAMPAPQGAQVEMSDNEPPPVAEAPKTAAQDKEFMVFYKKFRSVVLANNREEISNRMADPFWYFRSDFFVGPGNDGSKRVLPANMLTLIYADKPGLRALRAAVRKMPKQRLYDEYIGCYEAGDCYDVGVAASDRLSGMSLIFKKADGKWRWYKIMLD